MGDGHAAHARAVVRVADDEIGGKDAVLDDFLRVIEIVEQQVERGDPLNNARFDAPPILRGDQPWNGP
jgi:hypothetical protein